MKPLGSYFIFLYTVLCFGAFAQTTRPAWDTTRYQKFKSNLIVGIFQSYNNYSAEFSQSLNRDTAGKSYLNYVAESKLFTGIELFYEKLSLYLVINAASQTSDSRVKNARTLCFNLNYGDNRLYIENSFRYFKGFYNINTGRYDSTGKELDDFYEQPQLTNLLLRSKVLYFTNHRRCAIRGAYAGNYRQLKSAGTFLFSADVNYNSLQNDSSFFPLPIRSYYQPFGLLNKLNTVALAFNAGAAGTLVLFKGFFVNLLFAIGPEQQWRTYYYDGRAIRVATLSFSTNFRASIGVNLKRCYLIGFSNNDFFFYNSRGLDINNQLLSGGFSFGWRFNAPTSNFYKRFQKTKLYSWL